MFLLSQKVDYGRIGGESMISAWEKKLNIKPIVLGGKNMNLNSILSSVNTKNNCFQLNPNYPTIRYIEQEEYKQDVYKYVEPTFNEVNTCNNAKFILFSAPGATGKSALAKHVSYYNNGIYWDLPDNKVAEYSFQGAIMEAVGSANVSSFLENLNNGKCFLVIDAFDEAEAGSGRTGIEFFLRDLNNVTINCKDICAILFARTESAIFIKNFFIKYNISFEHYEVGYFAEYNAKTYIKYGLEKLNIQITDIVNECINAQFKEIKRIMMDNDTDSFLGYAPVLNALTASYDNDRNTLNLLKNTSNAHSSCSLLKKILDDLLTRERDKIIKALKVKIPKIDNYSESVYNKNEQLLRMLGKIIFNDSTFFVDIDKSIPVDFHEEYLEVVDIQLPQHPFICMKEKDHKTLYDFTGTAFRDFVIAYALSLEDICDFAHEHISNNKYCPSQMLIEFYNFFSNGKINGQYIPLMYDSYKAHAQLGDNVSIYINGNIEDCSIEFVLKREKETITPISFEIVDLENGIYINQLSNCYIDVDGKVYIGKSTGEARINNSIINCNEIVWRSEQISIEAYSPGECIFITNKISYSTDTLPRFEIKTDNKKNFKVTCPELSGYYKLLAYSNNIDTEDEFNNFISFSNLVRRIFSCLRSHGKDAPARKMDFIDNRIISVSEYKKNILRFLLNQKILYTDEQDWLYKLDTGKLSTFSIKWHDVRDGNFDSLNFLYEKYLSQINSTS